MPSLVLGRFFLSFEILVDVFLMMTASIAADHEVTPPKQPTNGILPAGRCREKPDPMTTSA